MFLKKYLKQKLSQKQKNKLNILRLKIKLFLLKKDIGKQSYIDRTVHVTGWDAVKIGNNSYVSEYTWLNINKRIINHKHIVVGDNCYIGRRNFFSSGHIIKIGSYSMTGIDCKLMGSDHVFNNPMQAYIASNTTNDKSINIGVNVWLGAGVNVLGDVSIGYGSIIGAGSMVLKDIPPFSIAVGNPCRVIKRFDFSAKNWVKIEQFTKKALEQIPDENVYLRELIKNTGDIDIPREAATKNAGDLF